MYGVLATMSRSRDLLHCGVVTLIVATAVAPVTVILKIVIRSGNGLTYKVMRTNHIGLLEISVMPLKVALLGLPQANPQ